MGRITLITAATDTATRLTVEGGGEVLAEPHMKYILKSVDGSPLKEAISVKREGQNLQLFVDDEKHPDLTLANYFSPGMDAQLYGIADDGQLAAYASARDDGAGGALQLADGEQVPLALAGETTSEIPVISQAHDYSPSFVPWTLAAVAGGVGVLAASRHSSGGSGSHQASSSHVEPPQVAISGLSDDTSHTPRPEILGSGTANATISLYDGNDLLGTTTVKADGTWRFTPEQDLSADSHSLTATATDAAGHTSPPTAPLVFTVSADNLDPEPEPEPEPQVPAIEGPVADGGSSDDASPVLSGHAQPGSGVTLYDNDALLGSTTADADGRWNFTPDSPLAPGAHAFTIDSSDHDHNTMPPYHLQITLPGGGTSETDNASHGLGDLLYDGSNELFGGDTHAVDADAQTSSAEHPATSAALVNWAANSLLPSASLETEVRLSQG